MEESEIDIVRQARRGDQQAFRQLFERYRRPILNFLLGLVGERELAEDLVQETIVRAFTLLPNLREEAKFASWIFGIARNVAREQIRRPVRGRGSPDLASAGAERTPDPGPNPEISAIKRQLYMAVNRGFAALDEDGRAVLALRVLGHKRYDEIAEITGWSLAKVKIELHRARLKMRATLEPFMGR